MVVYKTGSHSGFLTYDGIDVNGKRISDEILAETSRLSHESNLESSSDSVTKFSIVGYSLGGLISRYALGVLYHRKYFDNIDPVNFVTFCSPHVGVLTPGPGIAKKLFNTLAPYFLAHSGEQLFLSDSKKILVSKNLFKSENNDLPLLVWMADPQSVFFKCLSSFKYRSLYANVINDKRTCWFTSAIDDHDPFNSMANEDHTALDLKYVPNFKPVVDFGEPITFKKSEHSNNFSSSFTSCDSIQDTRTQFSKVSNLTNYICRKINWLKVFGEFVLYTPLWTMSFIVTSSFQRLKLNGRVDRFFKDSSNSLIGLYELIQEGTIAVANDDIHLPEETLSATQLSLLMSSRNYLIGTNQELESSKKSVSHINTDSYTGSYLDLLERDMNNKSKDKTDIIVESLFDAMNSESLGGSHYNISNKNKLESNEDAKSTNALENTSNMSQLKTKDNFELDLTVSQRFIVENLNTLKWDKFPIFIKNTKATHAAAIVRSDDNNFDEGKVVVDHFVKQVFHFN